MCFCALPLVKEHAVGTQPAPRGVQALPLDQAVAAQWGPAAGFCPLWEAASLGQRVGSPRLGSRPPVGVALKARGPPPRSRPTRQFGDLLPISSLWLSAVKLPTEVEGLMEEEDL